MYTADPNQVQAAKANALADATDAGLGVLHLPTGTIHLASASALPNHGHLDIVNLCQLVADECRGFTMVKHPSTGTVIVQNFSGLNVGQPGSIKFGMEQSRFDDVMIALRAAGF